ncbi:MAG: hypothetical protein LBI05_00080 [Planctomycetaceae bacterium]|jgi:hypothetical protein|nr:hypothetical protein [Planctomycetaceae bacterium]
MTQLDALSFFAMILFLSVFVSTGLWNLSMRRTSLRTLSVASGGLFTATWMFFVTGLLVMIVAFRNMLEPGLWERERLFRGLEPGAMTGTDSPIWNLLCGWFLFPLRQLPLVQVSWEGIAIGLTTLLLVVLCVEILGRRTLGTSWRSHWTLTFTLTFLWLDVMTYSTVALVRQIAWML